MQTAAGVPRNGATSQAAAAEPSEKRVKVGTVGPIVVVVPRNGSLAKPSPSREEETGRHRYDHLADEVALQVASRMGDGRAVSEFLRKGVDVEAANRHGWRSLHGAAANGRLNCLVALLAAKARVDASDAFGWQPLHDACARGEAACARELIRAGADKHAEDLAGMTPLDLARANRHDECVALLADEPAKPVAKAGPKAKKTPGQRKKPPSQPQATSRSRKRPASPAALAAHANNGAPS